MAAYGEEFFWDDEQIRVGTEVVSAKVYAGAFMPKTLTFSNALDQDVNVDVYGCSKERPLIHYKINAAPILVTAGSNSFETLEDYFQCFFLHLTAVGVPTSGGFTAEMLMTGGN
jgi:hypothetical protein